MKSVIFDRLGEPADVLHVAERPVPEPGRGEVRVRMLASPINPSDILHIQGRYGVQPPLPASPGFEGVGIVEKAGGGLMTRMNLGRRVAVLNRQGGNWSEYVVVPWKQAIKIPADLSLEQAASFFVNPVSAWVMVREVLALPAGAWLLQNAAASALGRMVIRLGRHYGFRTINVVRRPQHVAELRALGADEVIDSSAEDVVARVMEITRGKGVRYALDPVSGSAAATALACLGPGGRLILYGTLVFDPIPVDPRILMNGGKRIEGFWLSQWSARQGMVKMFRLLNFTIPRLIREGVLQAPVGTTYALDDIREAVTQAVAPGKSGKVLLRIGQQ